ncbi:hypothetical protein PF003_g12022 [Phytophthora fragariae]|nr:hypothetical protein PF003_g21379 [Phytophthora fragariae]KAE8904536.1 hypothetical protein PF003_g12022 [Phytophthora fragariae]
MVHALATMAMDGRRSRQVRTDGDTTATHQWNMVTRYLDNDMIPWIEKMDDTAQEEAVAASHQGRRREPGRRKPGSENC